MAKPSVGIKSFDSNREKVIKHVAKIANGNLRDFAETMSNRAKLYAPYLTGNLRDSIDFQEINPELFWCFAGGESAGYAAFQEFGTSRMTGRFYMARAFNETRVQFGKAPWE